jgi:hypothetical protein
LLLILHTHSHFGPYIFLKIFLSQVIRSNATSPVSVKVSLPYNIIDSFTCSYFRVLTYLPLAEHLTQAVKSSAGSLNS